MLFTGIKVDAYKVEQLALIITEEQSTQKLSAAFHLPTILLHSTVVELNVSSKSCKVFLGAPILFQRASLKNNNRDREIIGNDREIE